MAVRQDVHRHGVEMAIVTVCVMWHLVALMVVTAVGLGLGRVTWILAHRYAVVRRNLLVSVQIRQATVLRVRLATSECP